MTRLGLKKEEEVAIFLGLVIAREHSLLQFGLIFEMACNLFLLHKQHYQ